MQKTLVLLTLTALVACGDDAKETGSTDTLTAGGTGGGTGGTGGTTGYFYPGPLLVTSAASGCVTAGSGMDWVLDGGTAGWTGPASIFNSWETGNVNGWNEEHTLISIAFAPDGTTDTLQRTLTALGDTDGDGYSNGSYGMDASTLFSCGVHDVDPVMTYALRVYDIDGNFADCGIWTTDDASAVGDVQASPSAGWINPVSTDFELANCVTLM